MSNLTKKTSYYGIEPKTARKVLTMIKEEKTRVQVTLKKDQAAMLRDLATDKGISVSAMIALLCDRLLLEHQKGGKVAIQ